MRELAYTGRRMLSNEAKESGLVSDVYKTQKEMLDAANEMANEIATKSPVAIYGLKAVMNYSRDHSIKDSLDFLNSNMCSCLQLCGILNYFCVKQI